MPVSRTNGEDENFPGLCLKLTLRDWMILHGVMRNQVCFCDEAQFVWVHARLFVMSCLIQFVFMMKHSFCGLMRGLYQTGWIFFGGVMIYFLWLLLFVLFFFLGGWVGGVLLAIITLPPPPPQ